MNVLESGEPAIEIDASRLDAHVRSSYGIFAGQAEHEAVIHFSSHIAEWIADETWHPQQQSRPLKDGKWELIIPYHNPTELIMDILKYGPDAEVIAPKKLRTQVEAKLSQALRKYREIK